jgi:prepilin-type N-terminal cleavage/methylation domain-containing protein
VICPIDRSKSAPQKDLGFSLIEVLLVIVVISVLAAIAIPQFMSYRSEAIDAQLKSDLRNAAVAIESYYAKKMFFPLRSQKRPDTVFNRPPGLHSHCCWFRRPPTN